MTPQVARRLVWSEDSYPIHKAAGSRSPQRASLKAAPSFVQHDAVDLHANKSAPLIPPPYGNDLDEKLLHSEFLPLLGKPELIEMAQLNKAWCSLIRSRLTHVKVTNSAELAKAATGFPLLESMDLTKFKSLRDDDLELLSKNLTKIRFLRIADSELLTDTGVRSLAKLKSLRSLTLKNCSELTEESIDSLKGLELTKLDLTGCHNIQSPGLEHLKSFNTLTDLKLSGCDRMLDKGLSPILNLSHLKKLDLTWCEILEDHKISELVRKSPQKPLQIKTD